MNTPFRSSAGSVATVAAALALVLFGGASLTSALIKADQRAGSDTQPSGGRSADGHATFVDKRGVVLHRPQLYLIYWGAAWMWQAPPAPTPAQVTRAVRKLMSGTYLTGLAQYRGIGPGDVRGSAVITSSDPPVGFTDEQVAKFVDTQLTAGTIPGPDADNQTVYGVVMPPGITPGPDSLGEHNYYQRSGQRIHFAWFANVGDLAGITRLVSHELVESATDPEGSGFLGVEGTCEGSGWCEIADICEATWSVLDGITVQAYWSNQDDQCIVPGGVGAEHRTALG